MPLITIVQEYIFAALRNAIEETDEDGVVWATTPQFPGLVAAGYDVHQCSVQLWKQLDEWVQTSLSKGYDLPILDGIDLQSDRGKLLATYHRHLDLPQIEGEFYDDERALNAAFGRPRKSA